MWQVLALRPGGLRLREEKSPENPFTTSRRLASRARAWKAASNPTYCYDLHATILHLMGVDHERLTFRHNGIDRRLTDVHGHVISEVLA